MSFAVAAQGFLRKTIYSLLPLNKILALAYGNLGITKYTSNSYHGNFDYVWDFRNPKGSSGFVAECRWSHGSSNFEFGWSIPNFILGKFFLKLWGKSINSTTLKAFTRSWSYAGATLKSLGAIQKVCHRKSPDFWLPCHRLSSFALTPLPPLSPPK